IYHRAWLENFSERAQFIQPSPKPYHDSPEEKETSAGHVLDDYFRALFFKDWNNAWLRLSGQDRANISLRDFSEWRTAVTGCYEMQEYRIRYIRMLGSVTLDTITYRQAAEFEVDVTDLNKKNLEISTETLKKYVTYDQDCWKVCLGAKNVRSQTRQYRQMKRENFWDAGQAFLLSSQERTDTLTGLLNESGFFAEAAREVERNRRYHNPFTLLSFRVSCDDSDREEACICHLADTIRQACRLTDLAARLDNNQIMCLLAETDLESAEAAANKFMQLIRNDPPENYRVGLGLVFYNGYSSLSDAVLACCRMAGLPAHY
ncbi:MAG: hypothetical protein K2N94_02295, partial [Lachnospiraceae bacterium]|nr:hypothetical protein [Lachnospiraceae bacterium]